MIIEMRTYKVKPGRRSDFLQIFETKTVPAHQAIGMKIRGPFLSVDDSDTFFWMRGFPDLQSRGAMRDRFYESALWKQDLEHNLFPLLETFDVAIVEAPDDLGGWR